jgi:hypothetical protein
MMYNLKNVSTGEGYGSCPRMVYETAAENEEPEPQHSMVHETE